MHSYIEYQKKTYFGLNYLSFILLILLLLLYVSDGYAASKSVVTKHGSFKDTFVIRLKNSDSDYTVYYLQIAAQKSSASVGEVVTLTYKTSRRAAKPHVTVKTKELYHRWIASFLSASGNEYDQSHVFAALMVLPLVSGLQVPLLSDDFNLSTTNAGGCEGFAVSGVSSDQVGASVNVLFSKQDDDLNVTVMPTEAADTQRATINFVVMNPFVLKPDADRTPWYQDWCCFCF
ncbi:hypothetical protein ACWJJH_03205 [Endozoicomonadaceae bacterium StTr2]